MTLYQHQLDLVRADRERWLKQYYFIRAAFSAAWVAAAFAVGPSSATIATALLVLYPAWLATTNFVDALRSGGLTQNRTQALNVLVSVATTVAVILALQTNMNWVLDVFGAWAILSGLLQLVVRRWKSLGAQWAMVLSGPSRRSQAASSSFKLRRLRYPRSRMSRAMPRSARSTSWSRRYGSPSATGGAQPREASLPFFIPADRACRPCAGTGRPTPGSSCRCLSR